MNIDKIIASKTPPVDKFVGWLKIVNGKYPELNFFLNGAWRPVSIEEGSGDGTGGNSITEIECDTTYPLDLSAATEDGKAVITGSVNLDGYAQISDIPEKTSELTNDSGFVTQTNLESLKDELEKEIETAAEGGVTKLEVSGEAPLNLNGSIDGSTAIITGFIAAATTSSAGTMSAADKTKLDAIDTSNTVQSASASGTAPLALSASITNGALSITGSIVASSASANGYMSSAQYAQLANLVEDPLQYATAITTAEIDALFD